MLVLLCRKRALEITARACFEATWCSKSLLEHTSLENIAPATLCHTFRSESLLRRARHPLGARNHCSEVLRSHLAFEVAAVAGFFVFDSPRKQRFPTPRAVCFRIFRTKSLQEMNQEQLIYKYVLLHFSFFTLAIGCVTCCRCFLSHFVVEAPLL